MKQKWLSSVVLGLSLALNHHAWAQSPWPAVQAESYPLVSDMKLVRHEQSILLGEADQQTGLFFAQLGQTYSAQVQSQLISDAQRKGWKLETLMRYGTQIVLTFSSGQRLLDIRLATRAEGVEAVYSVVLKQQAAAARAQLSVPVGAHSGDVTATRAEPLSPPRVVSPSDSVVPNTGVR